MPRNAMRYLEVDYCRPLAEIPPVLVRLAQTPAATQESERTADMGEWTEALIQQQVAAVERGEVIDRPALASCPDCGGTIWRFQEGEFTQLQCREGHRYTAESFLARQGEALEQALWAVVRMLDERATCIRALAHHARAHQDHAGVATWEREAHEVQRKVEVLRQLLA